MSEFVAPRNNKAENLQAAPLVNNQVIEQGFAAQPNRLNQTMHLFYQDVYNQNVFQSASMLKEPELYEDYDDPKEEAKAKDEEKKKNPDKYLTEEEAGQLIFPANPEIADEMSKRAVTIDNTYQQLNRQIRTMEEEKKANLEFGMACLPTLIQIGEEYLEHLSHFPENDPLRDEKAKYLTMRDTSSKGAMMLLAAQELYQNRDDTLKDANLANKRASSEMNHAEMLKHIKVKDIPERFFMDAINIESFNRSNIRRGFNTDPERSAYDLYTDIYKFEMRNNPKRLNNFNDDDIAEIAFNDYQHIRRKYEVELGQKLAASYLPPEKRKAAEIGIELMRIRNYHEPKSIREWVKKEGAPSLLKNRPKKYNQNHRDFSKLVSTKGSLKTEEDPLFKAVLDPQIGNGENDKYLKKHMGLGAIGEPLEKQKMHLAKAMAVSALRFRNKKFDEKLVKKWAKMIYTRDSFRKMSPKATEEALMNPETVDNFRQQFVKDLYGVAPENRAAYIRDMKALGKTMVDPSNSSTAYKTLVNSIKRIGELDPTDPEIEKKLIQNNELLMGAAQSYAKGKKKVRTFEDGRDKFSCCVDSVALINKYVPGLKQEAKEMADRINTVRKTHDGDEYYVDLDKLGLQHAQQEKRRRDLRDGVAIEEKAPQDERHL